MRITILDGHPDQTSLTTALLGAYAQGAASGGHEVRRVVVRDLQFEPVLRGYRQGRELEADLATAQEAISWCRHLVVGYPVWWGAPPALLKGFIDRAFLPGFAFKFHETDPWWDRLLAGRSARMVVTSATPVWAMNLAYRNAPIAATRDSVLAFCGFKPVRVSHFGGVGKDFTPEKAQPWLARVEKLGRAGK
ncbi:MAG: NAD(P)H-dependent oxidoreductase [Lacipirellulaceae bacterium]